MSASGGRKAIIAALVANLGIAIAKFVAFLITKSASMLAESIHSMADSGNQGLLLFGAARANRAPDERHPFGYGRVRYFYAFLVAVVLFTVGALFAIYEGVHKLSDPHAVDSAGVAIGVLSVAIVLEIFSFRTAIVEANHVRGNLGWWQFVRQSKSPELPVVLLEDLAALVGLVLALLGVTLSLLTGNSDFDAYGTISIGLLLGVVAVILAIEMKGLLIGEAATPENVELVRTALLAEPQSFTAVVNLRTLHVGPDDVLVAAKVAAAPNLTAAEISRAIDAAEARVRQATPSATRIYIEPVIYDPARATS